MEQMDYGAVLPPSLMVFFKWDMKCMELVGSWGPCHPTFGQSNKEALAHSARGQGSKKDNVEVESSWVGCDE